MDVLIQKISKYLQKNPNSNARSICTGVGADKKAVNSCLYSNVKTYFLKEGLTPPLWRNVDDSSNTETVEIEITVLDDNEVEEDFEFEIEEGKETIDDDEDWTQLNVEDQQVYLKLNACIGRGEILSKPDRRIMNRLLDQIRQSERSEKSSIDRQERKARNKADYAAIVDKKVNEMWSVDEQRVHAIEALKVQFESNLRKLAYGYLTSSRKKLFNEETESDIEIRLEKSHELTKSVSSTIETRLNNLENLPDKELLSSSVRFGWINRDRTSRPDAKSVTEMVPQFEELEEVKIYRSRLQGICRRINNA